MVHGNISVITINWNFSIIIKRILIWLLIALREVLGEYSEFTKVCPHFEELQLEIAKQVKNYTLEKPWANVFEISRSPGYTTLKILEMNYPSEQSSGVFAFC